MNYIYRFKVMSSPAELILFSKSKADADKVARLVLQEAVRLEKKYSYYDKNSILSKLNQREESRLDFETKSLLQRAKSYYKSTDKIFDITIATIKDIYSTQTSVEDLQKEREKLLEFVGCEHFSIKKDKIIFDNIYTKIDLGGFVKEYAVDRASMILKKHKIKSALINFGGDIYVIGKKPNGEKFKIGIKDPADRDKHKLLVELEDEALTTSASYERSYKIQDRDFSHILSKNDIKNTPNSVSVISENCLLSGVYSTSLMINPALKTKYKTIIL